MYTVATVSNLEDLIRDHLRTQEICFQTENQSNDHDAVSLGALTVVDDRLIVTHHRRAQEAVAKFLETLEVLASSPASDPPSAETEMQFPQRQRLPATSRSTRSTALSWSTSTGSE